jgi:hypothetical protein
VTGDTRINLFKWLPNQQPADVIPPRRMVAAGRLRDGLMNPVITGERGV